MPGLVFRSLMGRNNWYMSVYAFSIALLSTFQAYLSLPSSLFKCHWSCCHCKSESSESPLKARLVTMKKRTHVKQTPLDYISQTQWCGGCSSLTSQQAEVEDLQCASSRVGWEKMNWLKPRIHPLCPLQCWPSVAPIRKTKTGWAHITPARFPHLGCFQLNLLLCPSNELFFLNLTLEETENFSSLPKSTRTLRSVLHRALGQSMQNVSSALSLPSLGGRVSPRLSHSGEPWWWLWSATEKRSFSPKEMRGSPEKNMQAVLYLSPERAQAGQRGSGMAIYKRARSSEAEQSKGKKGSFTSFWFLAEMGIRRLHSLSAHLWFSMSLPSL